MDWERRKIGKGGRLGKEEDWERRKIGVSEGVLHLKI